MPPGTLLLRLSPADNVDHNTSTGHRCKLLSVNMLRFWDPADAAKSVNNGKSSMA
jgi:hypothetical protein